MRATVAGALCLLCGCQTYDFEPVRPLAIAQTVKKVSIGVVPPKPNMFLVVDKSGSMSSQVSPGVSRLKALQTAMTTYLDAEGATAHFGVLPYPGAGDLCNAGTLSSAVSVIEGDDDDERLAAHALTVRDAINALTPLGGTPTGATMHALGSYSPLLARDRNNFAVLMTDGLPNCNDALKPIENTCTCTQGPITPCSAPDQTTGIVHNLCLDDDGTSTEIATLKGKGLTTIVIGFGTDVANPLGAQTLAAMAAAGGFSRPCASNADCNPGDSCSAGGVDPCGRPASTCGQGFFQAGNAAELGRAMDLIQKSLQCPSCRQVLNVRPSSPEFISVYVDGEALETGADTWTYHDDPNAPAIELLGATCRKVMTSSTAQPVQLEIRTVENL